VIYLASGVLGNVMSQVVRPFLPFFRPGVNTVGASGAICGLIGLMLVYGIRRGGAFGASIRSVMLQCAVSTLMMSFLPIVDSLCHLGGFAGGFLLGWVVPSGPFRSRGTSTLWNVLLLVTVGATLLAFYEVAVHGIESVRWLQAGAE
jgi:rhomboid protease GluP